MDDVLRFWPIFMGIGIGAVAWGRIETKISALHTSVEDLKKSTKEDISRLEAKQDKYNHLQERVILLEVHEKDDRHRIEEVEDEINAIKH